MLKRIPAPHEGRVEDRHQLGERKELPAMGVPRKQQVKTHSLVVLSGVLGLMGKKNSRSFSGAPAKALMGSGSSRPKRLAQGSVTPPTTRVAPLCSTALHSFLRSLMPSDGIFFIQPS